MPAHKALRYDPATMTPGRGNYILVPLTFQQKGVVRQFDMHGPDGTSVPVLGRKEDLRLVKDMLMHGLRSALRADIPEQQLLDTLASIIDDDADVAGPLAENLARRGKIADTQVLEIALLDDWIEHLLLDVLPYRYLMIALLPETFAGQRVVLKYALGWSLQTGEFSFGRRAAASFGYGEIQANIELSHPAGAASHHLEVVFPDGLEAGRLDMPVAPGSDNSPRRNSSDSGSLGTLHGAHRYPQWADQMEATITFGPSRGLRSLTLLVLTVTAAILVLGRWLPGAQQALLDAGDGAAALLLAVPALVATLLVKPGENVVVKQASSPLRFVVIMCALVLLACAGSLVGSLSEPYRLWLWAVSACLTTALGLALAWGIFRSSRRRTVGGPVHTYLDDDEPEGASRGA
ncbi:hypothetical protein [Brachybacterium sp. UNK5269]|uniref:hypothetical protein n=1 Tax=Brachybacterium sp. UNK5269 TaxID=3408576 RepID=UPI003BAE6C74